MKQIIIRVRDCRPTYTKTIKSFYFYSCSSYEYDAYDCVKDLMPGQELYIKVGNQYAKFISYEDVQEYCNEENMTFDSALRHLLFEDYSLNYNIKEYLPQY